VGEGEAADDIDFIQYYYCANTLERSVCVWQWQTSMRRKINKIQRAIEKALNFVDVKLMAYRYFIYFPISLSLSSLQVFSY
jgi:hypothetical protein